MKKLLILLSTGVFAPFIFGFAGNPQAPGTMFTLNGIALSGYDAVAYFTQQKAVKGDSAISAQWNGATWYFSGRQNLSLFESNPEKYAPQYGGYCAYGASKGYKAKTDPTAWTIVKGKLYLNYNKNVQAAWLPDTASRIPLADQYWQTVLNQSKN